MLKNRKVVLSLIGIALISWIFNLIFYKCNSIDEPVFTYIYYEGNGNGKIKYIIDENSNDRVTNISFPELNDFEVNVNINSDNIFGQNDSEKRRNDDNMARYNAYDIDMNTLINGYNQYTQSFQDEFEITELKYRTESGKEGTCDIGKIHYKNYEEKDAKYHLIEKTSGSSDEDCSEVYLKSLDDINMISINSQIKDMLFNYYDIKINDNIVNEDSLPIKIKRDEEVKVSIVKKKETPFYENIYGNVYLVFEDPEGSREDIDVSIPQSEYNNNFSYSDMNKLMTKRGLR